MQTPSQGTGKRTRRRVADAVFMVLFVLAALALDGRAARAQHAACDDPTAGPPCGGFEVELLVGLKLSYAWAHEGHGEHAGGAGAFLELPFLPGRFDAELSAQVLRFRGGAQEVPIDLLLKASVSFSDSVRAYLGVGPAIAVRSANDETTTLVGAAVAVGAYVWISDRFGWDLEVNYGVFGRGEHPVHDVTISFGPALRFLRYLEVPSP